MNKRRTIYRGFNKRRKTRHIQVIAITTSLFLVCGYGFFKIKNSNMIESISKKASFLKVDNILKGKEEFLGYDDYNIEKKDTNKEVIEKKDSELSVEKNNEEQDKEEVKKEDEQEIELARVEPWSIYTVQVASVTNDNDMNKIETQLVENKIPFSVVEIDGTKKVQTHGSFDKEITRKYIEEVKEVFPDAFISEMKVPVLAIEYTSKYSYIESITNELNDLIKNFEEESEFWSKNKENVDLKEYNSILTKRKNIVDNIEKEGNKINYKEMDLFKQNLINYTKSINEKIDIASKAANESNYTISESLHLSSMQEYFSFINSIRKA